MNSEFTEEETQMTNKDEKMLNSEEMKIKAKWDTTSHSSDWKNKVCKHQMLPRMCERKNSYITGGSVNWVTIQESNLAILYKVEGVFSLTHSISHLGIVKPNSNLKSDLMQLADGFHPPPSLKSQGDRLVSLSPTGRGKANLPLTRPEKWMLTRKSLELLLALEFLASQSPESFLVIRSPSRPTNWVPTAGGTFTD